MIEPYIVYKVDHLLDTKVSYKYKEQPLAQDWARIAKVAEELGETIAELILFTGQNPRKGQENTAYERMLSELADTAMTSIYAIQHFTKDVSRTQIIMEVAQEKHLKRLESEQ